MACYSGFGNLSQGNHLFWMGDFNGNGKTDVLFYYKGDNNWWLGSHDGNQLQWSFAGNTGGFGQVGDGRPFWVGRFSQSGRDEIMFYFPGDGNWWLGSHDGNQLQWSFAGNTNGFGQVWDGRPFWIGDFNGNGRSDVLFYFPGDGNWWLGSHDGNQLQWSFAGNTNGFGQVWDGRPFWVGRFSQSNLDQIMFYFPGDGNWWLGSHDGNQLSWSFAGNTNSFGQVWDGRPFWIGDFNGNGRSDVLFYFPGDGNWWLGSHDGNQLQWSFAGSTNGFGQVWDGRPFWIGRFSQNNRDQVMFYFPGDGNWWLGSHDGNQLAWSFAGNTNGFGQVWDGRPFWIGDYNGNGRSDVLFYFPGDGNWWLGSHDGNQLAWSFAGNTGRPCSQSVTVHFKTIIPLNTNVQNFIDAQFAAMETLFSEGGIAVRFGTTEDLSGNATIALLANLNVGQCLLGQPTQNQIDLFANRNNVGANDIVVCVVQSLIGGAGNFLGCATSPAGQPGCAVVQSNAGWLVAHEVAHVLGLRHVCQFPTAANPTPPVSCAAGHSDNLMFPTVNWTNVPPNISIAEYNTMLTSNLTNNC